MGDSDDEDIPDRDTCQSLCEQFAVITKTDTACAQFYLQDRKWDLQRSLDAYFSAFNKSDEVQILEDGAEPEVVIKFEGLAAAVAAATGEGKLPTRLKLISWNIDGLDEGSLINRTKAVCNTINCELPDVVFLQEVIPKTFSYIETHLPAYRCIPGNDDEYFTTTLIRRNSITYEEEEVIPFPETTMGRNMLVVKGKIGDVPLVLVNSHLESTAEHSHCRKLQLKTALKYTLAEDNSKTVVFGGDLNLRDKELDTIGGLPAGVEDLWIMCGSRPECRYTWDTTRNNNLCWPGRYKPRCRFDRLYLRQASPGRLLPKHFGLVGLERLKSSTRFPSDHWGLVVYFDLEKKQSSAKVPTE